MNGIKVDAVSERIILTASFQKKAMNPQSEEFREFARVRAICPNFFVVVNKKKVSKTLRISIGSMDKYFDNHADLENEKKIYEGKKELMEKGDLSFADVRKWFVKNIQNKKENTDEKENEKTVEGDEEKIADFKKAS